TLNQIFRSRVHVTKVQVGIGIDAPLDLAIEFVALSTWRKCSWQRKKPVVSKASLPEQQRSRQSAKEASASPTAATRLKIWRPTRHSKILPTCCSTAACPAKKNWKSTKPGCAICVGCIRH